MVLADLTTKVNIKWKFIWEFKAGSFSGKQQVKLNLQDGCDWILTHKASDIELYWSVIAPENVILLIINVISDQSSIIIEQEMPDCGTMSDLHWCFYPEHFMGLSIY